MAIKTFLATPGSVKTYVVIQESAAPDNLLLYYRSHRGLFCFLCFSYFLVYITVASWIWVHHFNKIFWAAFYVY